MVHWKRHLRLAVLLCATGRLALAYGQPAGLPPERWTLDNGLRVCAVQDDSTDLVAVEIVVRATADCERPNKAGLRTVLQHALHAEWERMTESRESLAFVRDMEDARGGLTTNTDWEYVGIGYSGMSETLPEALSFLAEAVFQPELTAESHEKAVALLKGAVRGPQSAPTESTYGLFRMALLQTEGRAYPLGTPDSIDAISLADLVSFHRRFYVPSLSAVCVIGPTPPEEVHTLVAETFGGLPPGDPTLPDPPAEPRESDVRVGSSTELIVRPDEQLGIASIVVGVPAPGSWGPDVAVAYIIHAILGGSDANPGRLERDDELWAALGLPFPAEKSRRGEFVESLPPPVSARAHLAIHAYAAPQQVEPVREALLAKFRDFAQKPPSQQELREAKAYVRNTYAVLFDMLSTRALMLGRATALDLPDPLALDFAKRVDRVTGDDVQRVAKAYFSRHAVGVEFPEEQF